MASLSSSAPSESKFQLLSASYASPTNEPFSHTHKIPTPRSLKPLDRTTYLAALRAATAKAQEAINRNLTARMEEDKARDDPATGAKRGVDEAKEEDNYGEEIVDEED